MRLKVGRPRDEKHHADVREQIKDIARKQMAAEGTTAIGLRAIAREMDMTAPALYLYYPSLDDLITALIVDAFNALGEAVEAADTTQPQDDYFRRLMAVLTAYRTCALNHPVDFQLIYGNPIPGYDAPADITVPAARRPMDVVVNILGAALQAGELIPPLEYNALPPSISTHLKHMIGHDHYGVQMAVIYISAVGWTRIHGMIMLELFNHIQPVIGDTDELYQFEVSNLCKSMGLKPKS